jgi:hypothetical protein
MICIQQAAQPALPEDFRAAVNSYLRERGYAAADENTLRDCHSRGHTPKATARAIIMLRGIAAIMVAARPKVAA